MGTLARQISATIALLRRSLAEQVWQFRKR
jgi:hypothetical protein